MPKPSQLAVTTSPTGSEWMVVVQNGVTSKVALSVVKQYATDYWAAQQALAAIASDPPFAKIQEGSGDFTDLYNNHHPTAEYLPMTDRTYAWVRDTYSTQGAVFIARAKADMPDLINAAIAAKLPTFTPFTDAQVSTMLTDTDGAITVGGWTLDIQYQDFTYGHTDSLGWHGGFNVTITVVSYNP